MYDSILMPTDGSPVAEKALEHAVYIANSEGATLHVIHIVDSDSLPSSVSSLRVSDELKAVGENVIERIRSKADADDLQIEGEVLNGNPSKVILNYADDHDIDLIVMGTHGRHGLDRYLIGSVAERVVRDADPPVLTVRYHGDDASETDDETPETV